jgi:hypothetical protein
VSTQISTRASTYNKIIIAALSALLLAPSLAEAGWKFKFNREATDMRGQKIRPFGVEAETEEANSAPKWVKTPLPVSPTIKDPLPTLMPNQELSLILTDSGFSPQKLHIKRGESYLVTVVNVSKHHKNSSFVIPSLSVYEGAYFADPVQIEIHAGEEGLYQFLSPESGVRGELVVYEPPAKLPEEVKPVEEPIDPPKVLPLRLPTSVGRD